MKYIKSAWAILKLTIQQYQKDRILRMGAALSYYTIFSLPALIIIMVGLLGFFLGEAATEGHIANYLTDVVGADVAMQVQSAVQSIGTPKESWWATVFGIGFLVFVATGIFYIMQEALNTVFNVQSFQPKQSIFMIIINRLLSFAMILLVCVLLIVSLVLNAVLLQLSNFIMTNKDWIAANTPPKMNWLLPYLDYFTDYFLVFINLGASIFLLALFFMLIYKILPAVQLRWRYVWSGAIFAAILFWFGQVLMGYYLSYNSVVSAYGAASSLIILLIWVYYSSQLVFLGAEFIKALYLYNNIPLQPKPFARIVKPAPEEVIPPESI